ncbi:transcriptional regulator, GntR family [Arthrobacter sp. 49Tsu3.1M3]|uniref:GntR family transcriptional regulator n=1 Tax=Arthrobacter sp. 49Tsu3.1M3 TaxID=1279029 RepID=UPI0009A8332B|nr:GntR family transcriptional regulator [Arthrobacter sp. 49Tsu3.1M3]SKB83822.1 transcriptional regulator, GntR family [Arthrobacter sp. 49Tsu3.1M3]
MASSLDIVIDRASPVPLYHQVAQGIEAAIRTGGLPGGARLDNEVDLAARLNLSRPTLHKAIEQLVQCGLVVRKRGVGAQVLAAEPGNTRRVSSHYDEMRRLGNDPTSEVISFSHLKADSRIRESLNLPVNAHVYHFIRLRKVSGRPQALMENWVRDDITELDEASLGSRGLYEILRNAGVDFRLANQRIGAMVANDYQANVLQAEAGAALVTMERTAIDGTGRRVETGCHAYLADTYAFSMTLVNRQ